MKKLLQSIFEKDVDIFKLAPKHYGVHNRDKILYYINENSEQLGFFAMYRCWLEYLYFADVCGYIPVIDTGEQFAYREEKSVNGTKNPYEYYFLQPSAIGPAEVKSSYQVIRSDLVHRKMVEIIFTGEYFSYKYNKRYLHEMSRIVKKYIQFNASTREYLKKSIQKLELLEGKTLGIHIRGTDFRGNYNGHPVYISAEDYFEEIAKINAKNQYEKIFIATDDQRVLDQFIHKYGETICFYPDIVRSNKNKSVAFMKNERVNHKYLLGLEVIRDMYTLSMCDALIAGISQVSICARINKMSRGEKYQDIVIIDKGINANRRFFK